MWIDFFADRATWRVEDLSHRLLADEQVGLTDVVLTELLHDDHDFDHLAKLSDLTVLRSP